MKYQIDLIKDVALLIDQGYQVVDAFLVEGRTTRVCQQPVAFYTYRSLLTLPEHCLLCSKHFSLHQRQCISSGGFHAMVAVPNGAILDSGHFAVNRSISFITLAFEDLSFFLESDHLFPAEEIALAISV